MNISTIALALTLSVASLQAVAQNVVLKPIDNAIETQACYTAATQGYQAARALVRANDLNVFQFTATVSCNGVSLKEFAQQYSNEPAQQATATRVAIVAKDTDTATQVCLDAISMGESEALAKHDMQGESVLCNFKNLRQFVRQYNSTAVIVRQTAAE